MAFQSGTDEEYHQLVQEGSEKLVQYCRDLADGDRSVGMAMLLLAAFKVAKGKARPFLDLARYIAKNITVQVMPPKDQLN